MGTMRILDYTGDTAVAWDIESPESLRQAEALFERLAGQHKLAFARPPGAPVGEATQIRAFDPAAEEIIWLRPLQGG